MKTIICSLATLASFAALAKEPLAHVVFLEPDGKVDSNRSEIREVMPVYRLATNREKYALWMKNESAERALRLYRQALLVAPPGVASSNYYVALVPGGNHAAVGFRIEDRGRTNEFARQPYILLGPEEESFQTTLLHETGHMIMALLAGGKQLDGDELTSIPHSTAALSDRATAFSEGWAIHLETLAAHLARSPALRRQYHREAVQFTGVPWKESEYFRHSADLTSYSQNLARYSDIRDNNFAFDSAFQGPDYLRVQLEKGRDFASLRDADQLLQSEGFHASFFFLFLVRGGELPSETVLTTRYDHVLRAMGSMFASVKAELSTPWLLYFVTQYMKLFPEDKTNVVDVLNDLSHGAFVDPAARRLWRDHYFGALQLDKAQLNVEAITAARKRWREQVLADPQILFSRVGPQLACTVPSREVKVAVFGVAEPVRFDLNTVPPGILGIIPGIREDEITRWLAERDSKPFGSVDDFRSRVGLSPETVGMLKF
jgi:hypothetical protein